MKVLDKELDENPTSNAVKKMVELRIQNLQCFRELRNYNDSGKWLYIHPLIRNKSEYQQLQQLRRKDPQEFLRQYALTESNIKRYKSYVKSPSREDKRKSDKLNLKVHEERAKIFKNILESEQDN